MKKRNDKRRGADGSYYQCDVRQGSLGNCKDGADALVLLLQTISQYQHTFMKSV